MEAKKHNNAETASAVNAPCYSLKMAGDKGINLFNCDWRELLPKYEDNHFELAIVDPPYGNGTKADNGTGEYSRGWLENKKSNWDKRPDEKYFEELKRVSKNQIIWGGNFFELPVKRGWICWYKTNEVKGRDFSEFELAWTSFDRPTRHYEQKPFIRNGRRIHPTQKPIALYRWLLQNYANEGDRILDTHLGSGSIAIACYEEKFDLVACEIDQEYFEAMKNRVEEYRKQLQLF